METEVFGMDLSFQVSGGDVFDYSGSKFHSESSKSRKFMRGLCMVLEKPPKTTVTRKTFVGALLNMNIGPLSPPPKKTHWFTPGLFGF